MKVRLGSRRSPLAKTQTAWVAEQLRAAHPGLELETVWITTTGDKTSAFPSYADASARGGLKADFTKEIEEALLAGHIDVAVHSMKDLPGFLPAGLLLAAVPVREDPRDAWVSERYDSLEALPPGARVGTGAIRRQAQLRHARADLELVALRGNVETRLEKLEREPLAGLVLAAAGLRRLGLEKRIRRYLDPSLVMPAVGQGCLAIETRENDRATRTLLEPINDPRSYQAAQAERAFLKTLGGHCQTPLAGWAEIVDNRLVMRGRVIHPSGTPVYEARLEGSVLEAEALGTQLAQRLLADGAAPVLAL